jgi:hypothetical protein
VTNSKPLSGAVRMSGCAIAESAVAVMVNLELSKEGIDLLVENGWLRSEQRHDRQAVGQALLDLGARALWPG